MATYEFRPAEDQPELAFEYGKINRFASFMEVRDEARGELVISDIEGIEAEVVGRALKAFSHGRQPSQGYLERGEALVFDLDDAEELEKKVTADGELVAYADMQAYYRVEGRHRKPESAHLFGPKSHFLNLPYDHDRKTEIKSFAGNLAQVAVTLGTLIGRRPIPPNVVVLNLPIAKKWSKEQLWTAADEMALKAFDAVVDGLTIVHGLSRASLLEHFRNDPASKHLASAVNHR